MTPEAKVLTGSQDHTLHPVSTQDPGKERSHPQVDRAAPEFWDHRSRWAQGTVQGSRGRQTAQVGHQESLVKTDAPKVGFEV